MQFHQPADSRLTFQSIFGSRLCRAISLNMMHHAALELECHSSVLSGHKGPSISVVATLGASSTSSGLPRTAFLLSIERQGRQSPVLSNKLDVQVQSTHFPRLMNGIPKQAPPDTTMHRNVYTLPHYSYTLEFNIATVRSARTRLSKDDAFERIHTV